MTREDKNNKGLAALLPILATGTLLILVGASGCKALLHTAPHAGEPDAPKDLRSQRSSDGTPLGTAAGEPFYSPVVGVRFRRSSHRPLASATLYYDSPGGVRRMLRSIGRPHYSSRRPVVYAAGVSMRLTDARGRGLSGYRAAGKTIISATLNTRYVIVLRNHRPRWREVVLSVDGTDVIGGGRADTSRRGYLLRPGGKLRVKGFRRGRAFVAAFRFSRSRRAQASVAGRGVNIGVIGLAVFGRDEGGGDSERRLLASPFADGP